MDLKDLIAISGYPGLFRFVTQGRNAIIVESLEDKKRISAYSTTRMSTLEEIAVFTEKEEMPLAEVLKKMYDHTDGKEALSHKSANEEIKKFFEAVLPDYDKDKVYVSDMKKIIHWYNLLIGYGLIDRETEEKTESAKDDEGGKDEKTDAGEEKNPGVLTGRKPEGFVKKKPEGHLGSSGKSPRNPGKAIRMPRKT